MRARSSLVAVCADIAVVAAVLAVSLGFGPGASAPTGSQGDAVTREEVVALIHALPVAEPSEPTPYDRAQFPHWIEITAGCDTRCAVLDRQRSPAGWWSAYDGYVARTPTELEIDHVVPLAEAWRSGAAAWSVARREAFANDLIGPELLAVSAWSNRDKGAADPSTWRPPDPTWWCNYAATWAAVKLRWSLAADPAEIVSLLDLADHC